MDPWLSLEKPLKQPWETGFLTELEEAPTDRVASLALDNTVADCSETAEAESLETEVLEVHEVADDADAERDELIKEFEGWVRTSTTHNELRGHLAQTAGTTAERHVVSDALLERSTGTLRVRFSALRGLAKATGLNPLDCGESVLYNEFCKLREAGAAVSRAAGQLQACRLAAVVAETEYKRDILGSKRLVGAAYGPQDGVARQQKAGLTLKQLVALEKYIARADDLVEKAVAGQVLFCVYSQSRWSDAQRLLEGPSFDVDGDGPGVVEAVAMHTKGQKGLKRLRMTTPIVALAFSVSGVRWWDHWRRARLTLKLGRCPCMPGVGASRSLTRKMMTTSYVTRWLRGTLATLQVPEINGKKIGSHSCKATLQSWTSRWGLSPSARRILGHHLKPGDRMGVVYSRDHVIGPLGGVVRMIQAIRDSTWDPDCSRSVLLKVAAHGKDQGGALQNVTEFKFASRTTSSSSARNTQVDDNDITDDESEESDCDCMSDEYMIGGDSEMADSDVTVFDGPVINEKSGIVHDKVNAEEDIAKCGVIVKGFVACKDLTEAAKLGAFCRKCYPP